MTRPWAPARPAPRLAPARERLHRPYVQRRVPVMNWTDRALRAFFGWITLAGPRRLRHRGRIARVLALLEACPEQDGPGLRRRAARLRGRR